MTDRFASFDAAYVLGALSAEDRQAYEEHLHECPDCARSVRELAGLPGLLGKVPDELAVADEPPAPPSTLLPRLLAVARRQRWRRRAMGGAASAVAVAACVALAFVLALGPTRSGSTPVAEPTVAMTPLVSVPLQAKIGVDQQARGTRVTMHCAYRYTSGGQAHRYTLVLLRHGGRVQRLTSWSVAPGEDVTFRGTTHWRADDIAAVEIRSSDGTPLLRLKP